MISSRPNFQNISIRDLTEADIPSILKYWFHSPPGFVESMGVDPNKMPSEVEFRKNLTERCRQNAKLTDSKLTAVIILYEGRPIGFHTIFPLIEGDHAVFHAHIWDPNMRGKGVGLFSYAKACQIFIKRFDLQRMLFKTPMQNTGPLRIKEKLGIPCIGEEVIDFGILQTGTRTKVFELTKEEADLLVLKMASYDVDQSQIDRNLSLTPEQRLIEHQNALDLVWELERAGKEWREESQ